ncbi:fimbrial chaperone [Escherichia coli]|uniref:fimbrial chaperone n=1 Tax=Escherichia coli TaxID=562 RepID=UPI0003EF536E|nr:fimbrial chaperone [Escherichia coli]MED9108275.1 fimbrial chaperone [Escherichia marmotae]AQW76423.1 fimbrial chaperone protein [Escherichia coli M8]EFH3490891.1 fimbrial chaperone [Escherichia coli]EFN9660010.1 fimbrial chaperone [Escherichia coli]EHG3178738.1 fimbrial chaperone [Escherichia coli]
MNKVAKTAIAVVLSFAFCSQAMAAFVLNGTRFIYDENKKNITFEVTNNASQMYGGQVWVDNTSEGNGIYMVPQPPFFKVGAKQKQIIRIMKTDSSLPTDRESLFWLNVQEVPPKPDVKENRGSVLAIAMNSRVKLIYRPSALKNGRENAEKKLTIEQRGDITWVKNPTPYYMAIVGVQTNGRELKLSDKVTKELTLLAPFSSVSLGVSARGSLKIAAINDWGGVQNYEIH